MKRNFAGLSLAMLAAVACSAHNDEASDGVSAPDVDQSVAQALSADGARVLNLVAHPDDDLFTMNPDLWNNIAAGRAVQSIVFTAGDGNYCQSYVEERNLGQKLAWEKMAGV